MFWYEIPCISISDNVLIDQALFGDFGDNHLESSRVKCAVCDYEHYESSSNAFQITFDYCCCWVFNQPGKHLLN